MSSRRNIRSTILKETAATTADHTTVTPTALAWTSTWSNTPTLPQGAIEAVFLRGSDEQKQRFLHKMVSGEWTGTMNLTEPQATDDATDPVHTEHVQGVIGIGGCTQVVAVMPPNATAISESALGGSFGVHLGVDTASALCCNPSVLRNANSLQAVAG